MRQSRVIAAAALAWAAAAAFAHGDDEHATPRGFDASQVEATAFGEQGDPRKVSRTIRIDMTDDMRFAPAAIEVKKGQTVRFVAHNSGRVRHEIVLGTPSTIAEHAALMRRFPEMEHADANMVHVKPGRSGDIVWRFTQAGEFEFACLQPGHFEAGMVGKVSVR